MRYKSRMFFFGLILAFVCVNKVFSADSNSILSRTDAPSNPLKPRSAPSEGHCIWFGQCNQKGSLKQNCVYNGTAKSLNQTSFDTFKQWCPHMDPTQVCCDDAQVATMSASVTLAANFLKRCPSCMSNLVKHICELTCSPHQSTFIEVVHTNVSTQTNRSYVDVVNYYITQDFLEKTYNSCKQVSVPSTGQLAMDLMCGNWGALRCSANRWFGYMGTADEKNNPFVPFQINYINSTSSKVGNYTPLNLDITPCNKGLDANTPACSCVDCEASCPVPPPQPPKPAPFVIVGFNGLAFLMTVVFVIGSVLFLLAVFFCSSGGGLGARLIDETECDRGVSDVELENNDENVNSECCQGTVCVCQLGIVSRQRESVFFLWDTA